MGVGEVIVTLGFATESSAGGRLGGVSSGAVTSASVGAATSSGATTFSGGVKSSCPMVTSGPAAPSLTVTPTSAISGSGESHNPLFLIPALLMTAPRIDLPKYLLKSCSSSFGA